MPKVLTDGKTKIGAYKFKDRKRIALCIEKGNAIKVYGYFTTADGANRFMEQLGKLVNADIESEVTE